MDVIHIFCLSARRYHSHLGHGSLKLYRCRIHWPGRISSPHICCQNRPRRFLQLSPRFQPILPQPSEQTTRRCHLKAQGSHKVQLHSTVARQVRRYSHKISTAKVESATSHSYEEAAALSQKDRIASPSYREHPRPPITSLFPAYDSPPTGSSIPIPSSATSTSSTRATS